MRSSKSRSRGKNRNNNRSMGNIVNRVFDSSGPEGKVRGTPQQIIDKYLTLHRDAQLSNDRVAAENFQQHAEHYVRMLGEAQREQDARRVAQEAQQRDRTKDHREVNRDNDDSDQRGATEEQSPKKSFDAGQGDQPDVIDLNDSEDSGLVETVESVAKPPRKPRSRKPRAEMMPDLPDEPVAENDADEKPAAE